MEKIIIHRNNRMKMVSTKFSPVLIGIILLLLLSTSKMFGQGSDCENLTNPIYSSPEQEDPCCGYYPIDEVCYDLTLLPTEATIPYLLYSFSYNGVNHVPPQGQGPWSFNNPSEISTWLTNYCQSEGGTVIFSNSNGVLCGSEVNPFYEDFGDLLFCYQDTLQDFIPCPGNPIFVSPEITHNPCPFTEPDMSVVWDSEAAVPNLNLMNGVQTQDIIDQVNDIDDDGYSGPSGEVVGAFTNGLFSLIGSGCNNMLNCFDLDELLNEVVNIELNPDIWMNQDLLQVLEDENIDISQLQDSIAAGIQSAIDSMGSGSFAGYINELTGLNFPDYPCDEDIQIPSFWEGGGIGLKGKPNGDQPEQDPPSQTDTEADPDFFSSEIAGLGAQAQIPGAPNLLEMLQSVDAGADLYNGAVSLNIPLYNLSANDLNIPISLTSSGNGLTVNDIGTQVGHQWSLNAGGKVTRTVRGLPDEYHGTVTGVGIGKEPKAKFRVEIPSSLGAGVVILTDLMSSPSGLDDVMKGIQVFSVPEIEASPVQLRGYWSALNPLEMNVALSVQLFTISFFSVPISVKIHIGMKAGMAITEKFMDVNFEEEGLGYLGMSDPTKLAELGIGSTMVGPSFHSQSSDMKEEILKHAHWNRKVDDLKFFSDFAVKFDEIIQSLKNEDNRTYKTKRLDTEPDEFHFTAGSYSGTFYLDRFGNPVIFPDQDLEIEYTQQQFAGDTHITSFSITTPDGTRYTYGSNSPYLFHAVDFTENINYQLSNYFTYDEENIDRTEFGDAKINIMQQLHYPLIGPLIVRTYHDVYDRNYRIMNSPKYSSTWHLVRVESLLTSEEISIEYKKDHGLRYYSDKSYSHTFPNFGIENGSFKTTGNYAGLLNDYHTIKTRWRGGRADFTYSVTETIWDRSLIDRIITNRGEEVRFDYSDTPRGSIVGDVLCNKVEVFRSGSLYKGWDFLYHKEEAPEVVTTCTGSYTIDAEAPPISIPTEQVFHFKEAYDMKWVDYHRYFQFYGFILNEKPSKLRFRILRLNLPIFFQDERGGAERITEFGSLMQVKSLNDIYNAEEEEAIFNAEGKRDFLIEVREIDKNGETFDFVEIEYEGNTSHLPKRYSVHQDLFGYYNDNSITGSPLPAIRYRPITNYSSVLSIEDNPNELSKHFGFFAQGKQATFHNGQNETPSLEKAVIGSVNRLTYASGAEIDFSYELNELNEDGDFGAGVRVKSILENPGSGMPSKLTSYEYHTPTMVNFPIRLYQNQHDIFSLVGLLNGKSEERVVSTSAYQNKVFLNGRNYVGYERVAEKWDGIGKVEHNFVTPENYETTVQLTGFATNTFINTALCTKREGMLNYFSTVQNCGSSLNAPEEYNLPPSLQIPEGFKYVNWIFGLEHETKTFGIEGGSEVLRQSTSKDYSVFSRSGKSLRYFNSIMYQHYDPGSFADQLEYRLIKQFFPLPSSSSPLVTYLVSIIYDGATTLVHPFKRISRDYLIRDYNFTTGVTRLNTVVNTDYYEGTSLTTSSTTQFTYLSDHLSDVPLKVTTTYSDGNTTSEENMFLGQDLPNDIEEVTNKFTPDAITYLNSIGYKMPIAKKSFLNNGLVGAGFTSLKAIYEGTDVKFLVPMANYTIRNGNPTFVLAGVFDDEYNSDGKPLSYRLAKHGALFTPPQLMNTEFFEPITLAWNSQLQLTSRTYGDFVTSYYYNTANFELDSIVDPNGIKTTYAYDERWRVVEVGSLNGKQTTGYEYNIEPDNNYVRTTLSFSDLTFPSQLNTQYSDGFGRTIRVERDNDGAVLQEQLYDNFFRIVQSKELSTGDTYFEYEPSPVPRWTQVTDAAGNVTKSWVEPELSPGYHITSVKDPNEHVSKTYNDGLSRPVKAVSGEGGITTYSYDFLGRPDTIANPIGEIFVYNYNELGKPHMIKVPGSEAREIWWDVAFRPAAMKDGNGTTQIYKYDDYNRIVAVYLAEDGTFGASNTIVAEDSFEPFQDVLLLDNVYEQNKTWLEMSSERIMDELGYGAMKHTEFSFNDVGWLESTDEDYNGFGGIVTNISYTDAGIPIEQTQQINSIIGPGLVKTEYLFAYDDLLRPDLTKLSVNGSPFEPIARLQYNSKDQVRTKYLGPDLQKVDYLYDASGRLTHINTPGEMECYLEEEFCAFELTFVRGTSVSCTELIAIEVNGNVYSLNSSIDILFGNAVPPVSEQMEAAIEAALDTYGLFGEASVTIGFTAALELEFQVLVTNSNASSLKLLFEGCAQPEVFTKSEDCCEPGAAPAAGDGGLAGSGNPDLFYEHITYSGLDISRIDMGSNCMTGFMRNEYQYDANHRLTDVRNTFFMPEPVVGLFSSNYTYDLAGNLLTLKRFGLEDPTVMGTTPFLIDDLDYGYNQGSRLNSVTDLTSLPQGFAPSTSTYDYDGAGNIDLRTDDGTELTIGYNLLNLPGTINHQTDGDIRYGYTFGGHKFLKETELVGDSSETRLYLGGAEFVNGQPESYYHGEGRVALTGDKPAFQYKLTDHLGNTMVLFEDRDGDGIITTESMNSNDPVEVLQRNFYYAFGLPMQGPWNHAPADPDMPYLYNGKELEGELGLGWMDYGARRYDAAIGRWGGVDPLAILAPDWTPYRYGFNNPVLYIDPNGLFESKREARAHAKSEGIKTGWFSNYGINKNKDADGNISYSIDQKDGSWSVTNDSELGIIESNIRVSADKITSLDKVSDGFWDLMRDGDSWLSENQRGERFAQTVSDFNPLISGANAYYGFTRGQNIYGQQIGNDEASIYAASVLPVGKAATGLKLLGGGTLLSGTLTVSKKAIGIKPVGSPNTLLSSAILFKLGLRQPLGRKVPTLVGPNASHLHTALGRNAIPIGGGMIGLGFLLDELENE